MCGRLTLLVLVLCVFCLCAQAAEQQYLITESQLKNIEALVEKSELDRQSWELQARGLKNKAENLENEAASLNAQLAQERTRYWNLERSFNKLEVNRSKENQEKDSKILNLTQSNAGLWKAVYIIGSVLGAIFAYLIIRLILWIKGGGATALLIKKTVGGER